MNENRKPLTMMLQGAIFTVACIIIIFMTILSQVTILAFLISIFLGVIFGVIGLAMLCQGYRLIKKLRWR